MINQLKLIEEINKQCKIFFLESSFVLSLVKNRFQLMGDNISKAVNNHKNDRNEISVLKWFDDYWIYIEIRFENKNTFISISVFQGEISDNIKNQLFRAEWDDYNNPDEKHPQPHWHITSNQAIENTFAELIENDKEEGFAAFILNEEKSKIIDINKIHFPMNGNWINNDGHIHLIDDNEKIVRWFQGFFSVMKSQLQYVK